MALGLIGKKRGMTRVFLETGESVPVTVIEVDPNRVTRVKNVGTDGYDAVQVTTGTQHRNRVNKALSGEYAKAGTEVGRGLWEFRAPADTLTDFAPGTEIKVDIFADGQKVDVTGTTIGKGFQGGIKRHHFRGQDSTHGNSLSHRAPGSIGQCQTPGRVFKGKKMAGHLGNKRRTTQNLELVRVDAERNLLLVKGAVPGSRGGDVMVRPAVKSKNKD